MPFGAVVADGYVRNWRVSVGPLTSSCRGRGHLQFLPTTWTMLAFNNLMIRVTTRKR